MHLALHIFEFLGLGTTRLPVCVFYEPRVPSPVHGFGVPKWNLLDCHKTLKRKGKPRTLCLETLSVLHKALTRSSL